jgi:hypothetical protein
MIFQMKTMTRGLAALAFACGAPALAQEAPPAAEPSPAAAPAAATGPCCTIPALTPVEIEIVEEVGSKTSKVGEPFKFRLAEPLVVEGRIVAPAGTPGVGEVVHAAKARAMGKAGELILAARYLDLGGQRVPLRSFHYGRGQGKDNSGAVMAGGIVAAAVLPIAGLAGFLISGGDIHIPAGTRANAKVSADTAVARAN